MGGLFEGLARRMVYLEDQATDRWKRGDKVPPGYRVVFGKLRKVGGSPKAAPAASGGSASGAASGGSSGGGSSWQDLGLFGDDSRFSSDDDAKEAAKEINGVVKDLGDWAAKNKDRLSTNKAGDVFFDSQDDEDHVTDMVDSVLHAHKHTGALDTEVREKVYGMVWDTMRKAGLERRAPKA